ncbi:ribonucleotide-diphosphate reductase subunit beta, partial [Acinetobacter baumannii]
IFSTLSPLPRIEALFRWAEDHPLLQAKVARIAGRYREAAIGDDSRLYLALASSVLLESYLFYSGFYYPLFLAGGGRLVNSGE